MKEKIIAILNGYVSETNSDTYYGNVIDENKIDNISDDIVNLLIDFDMEKMEDTKLGDLTANQIAYYIKHVK